MELWELVRLVSERYGKRLEQHKQAHPAARELGQVTLQQFQYLQAVRRGPSATIGSLSAYFGVRSPTATVLVARLEEKGLVKRSPDPQDGRSNRLVLTPRAQRLLEVQEAAFKALGEDIRAALSPSDLKLYTRLTEQVCIAFEKLERDG
jgi:DNA-binding MarR family transcriptional regulator